MSSLVLKAMLGLHRIPANMKTKKNFVAPKAQSTFRRCQAPVGHLSEEVTAVTSLSTQENSRCSLVLSLPGSCMSPVSKAPEHVAESSARTASMLPKCFADLVQEMKHQDFHRARCGSLSPALCCHPAQAAQEKRLLQPTQ